MTHIIDQVLKEARISAQLTPEKVTTLIRLLKTKEEAIKVIDRLLSLIRDIRAHSPEFAYEIADYKKQIKELMNKFKIDGKETSLRSIPIDRF